MLFAGDQDERINQKYQCRRIFLLQNLVKGIHCPSEMVLEVGCGPQASHLVFFTNDILCHLEGAEVFVHVLHICVLGRILVTVQQSSDGFIVIVDNTAILLLILPWQRQKRT